jgi:hypothetical protein
VVPDTDGTNGQPGSPAESGVADPNTNPAGGSSTNTPGGVDNSPPSPTDGGSGTDGTNTN